MANLPPRDILLAMLARTVAAPITGLMGVMNQKILTLLYALNAIKEKKDQA
jgi:large subunit ribosomal protein L10